jgi:zinc/manganese transport system permease protein
VLEAIEHALITPFVEFSFMRRALVGTVVLGIGAAPLGVFLMLRRMSLTGDAMAHAILPGAALGYLVAGLSLPAMTIGGIGAGLIVALLSGLVARTTVLREDASLAAFYLISLALGVLLVSLRGNGVDLLHLLFGNVLALDDPTLILIAGVTSCTLPVFALIYRGLVAECVDPGFLQTVRGRGSITHMVFLTLVVANLVAGFQALGTLLVVGIMMLPAVSARFWSRNLSGLIVIAVLIAIFSTYTGLLASYHFSVPAGPAVVFSAGLVYIFSILFGHANGIVGKLLSSRHLEA